MYTILAEVAKKPNVFIVLQISYASSSARLSDRSKYRSFFRTPFDARIVAPALRSAVVHFNWSRIALLTQNEGLFTGV